MFTSPDYPRPLVLVRITTRNDLCPEIRFCVATLSTHRSLLLCVIREIRNSVTRLNFKMDAQSMSLTRVECINVQIVVLRVN